MFVEERAGESCASSGAREEVFGALLICSLSFNGMDDVSCDSSLTSATAIRKSSGTFPPILGCP